MFYEWNDCSRAIGVHDEAVFRGFRTLQGAEAAYASYESCGLSEMVGGVVRQRDICVACICQVS